MVIAYFLKKNTTIKNFNKETFLIFFFSHTEKQYKRKELILMFFIM